MVSLLHQLQGNDVITHMDLMWMVVFDTSPACHVACTHCRTVTITIKASVCLGLIT